MHIIIKFYLSNWLILLFVSIQLNAQILDVRNKDRVTIADSLFMAEQYSQALAEYKILLEVYPKDPQYHFKAGVCYVESTRDATKAIDHLKFASTRDVPTLVYYYLGRAFQQSYQFDEGISYYRRFLINGGAPSVTTQQIESLVSQCENGNFMLKYVYQPKVIDRKKVSLSDFNQYIITKAARGSFIPTPNDLKTPTDIRQKHSSIIFYPNNPKPGDKVVYSSYGSNPSNGTDIFMIEMLEDGFWSKPQNLGNAINSKLDEDFPYLAPDGITLYFASKGHYSMGGYDVYRSVYNTSSKQWSSPENLGFPFSSPFNDMMYVPDSKEDKAILVTDRNIAADSVEVVLVSIDHSPIRRTIDSFETIRTIAELAPVATPLQSTQQTTEEPVDVKPKTHIQPMTASFSSVENDPEYARALTTGFTQQMRADSLRSRLENLRARFDNIYTAEARINLEAQVVAVEDDLLASQRNADVHFARASQIEQEYLTGKRKPADKPTSTFASDQPDFLYQAQFASTVFQHDEINLLAQLEKATPQVQRQREEISQTSANLKKIEKSSGDKSTEYNALYTNYLRQLRNFNSLMGNVVGGKKKLYSDCISVALIKADANSNLEVKGHIDRANSHFRAANAIRNNAIDETRLESEYEALLLDELGVSRLEIAFAKLWEMVLFEQQLLSRVYRLEQSIFGRTLPDTTISQTLDGNEIPSQSERQNLIITRVDSKPLPTNIISFQPDEEPPFQIIDSSTNTSENQILPHEPLPSGVIYKIQLAALANPAAYEFFKGMVPISAEPISGGRITKYYVGNFKTLNQAESVLPIVRSKGFKDSFIVAWHDGRSVALSRAKALEATIESNHMQDAVRIELEKGNKLYVIHIGSYTGRLPSEITQTIRALAPGKDIVRKPDNQGGFIYSVGSYSDLIEATRVKDNLIASGIKSALVVAVELDN